MKILNKNQTSLLLIFVFEVLLLSYQYVGGNVNHAWPDSDASIFSLMALHLMQGEAFHWYFYGQDYIGSFPVLIIFGLFELLGISQLWVDFLYAAVYSGIVTLISAFLIKKTGLIPVLVFAISFAFFPSELSIPRALDSGTHNFSIFAGLLTGYCFCLFIEAKLSKRQGLAGNKPLMVLLIILLAGLTYWSSQLGFIFVIAIISTALISCRKHLLSRYVEQISFFQIAMEKQLELKNFYPFFKKWQWFILSVIFLSGLLFFDQALFNAFLIFKIYFIHLFSRIAQPMNYFWAIVPFVAGIYLLYHERSLLTSMLQGNEIAIPWHWALLSAPICNVIFSLPTTEHLEDYSSARYFESLQWMNLFIMPLLFSLLFKPKLRNIVSIGYLFLAIISWYSDDFEDYERIRNPLATIEFIQARQDDTSRLLADEKTVIDFLDKHKLYYGYADYWLAYRLTWLSHEKFIISPYKDSRYQAYDERIEEEGSGFYLFYIENLANGREIAKQQGKENEARFGELIIFY